MEAVPQLGDPNVHLKHIYFEARLASRVEGWST
jgi:hypothetical protein